MFTILRKYVRYVRLGARPFDVQYSYRFDDVFSHHYYETLALHLCG